MRTNPSPRMVCCVALAAACGFAASALGISLTPAEHFFSTIAGRLLEQQLGVHVSEIQIAPTNQYTPAVHRIFQVTANIYDATSTNETPTVFRPFFSTNGSSVYLAGFTNDNRASTLATWIESNPYDVPLIIAARKGVPNFNEFVLQTDILTQRRLQLTRPTTNSLPNGTNQMYMLSISNFLGVEAWNSSMTAYPRAVQLSVSNYLTLTLTNELGHQFNRELAQQALTNIPAASWTGGISRGIAVGFVLPLFTNVVGLGLSPYLFASNAFGGSITNFETLAEFPVLTSTLIVSNHLTYTALDSGRVIDFVKVHSESMIDLQRELWGNIFPYPADAPPALSGVWDTNRLHPQGSTFGILRQIEISLDDPFFARLSRSDWQKYGLNTTSSDIDLAISLFRDFCRFPPLPSRPVPPPNPSLTIVTPFNPVARLLLVKTWAANDPMLHQTALDLANGLPNGNSYYLPPSVSVSNIWPSTLRKLNNTYSPWHGHPDKHSYPEGGNRALKDAGVSSASHWNFPTNEALAAHWLGRVHRGTPWQTIYLQSDVADISAWLHTGRDAREHPTNDWRMASMLAALFNTNDVRALRSINDARLEAWTETLCGLTVLSNNRAVPNLVRMTFDAIVITSNAPQIRTVVDALNRVRSEQSRGFFPDVAAFLSVPELSSQSPWLNLSDPEQARFALSDEAYEALPSQLLSKVRPDSFATATRTGATMELRFTAFDGYRFRVEHADASLDWQPFSEPHYSTNGTFGVPVTPSLQHRFFRAVLLPEP